MPISYRKLNGIVTHENRRILRFCAQGFDELFLSDKIGKIDVAVSDIQIRQENAVKFTHRFAMCKKLKSNFRAFAARSCQFLYRKLMGIITHENWRFDTVFVYKNLLNSLWDKNGEMTF